MTAAELIAELQRFPPQKIVRVLLREVSHWQGDDDSPATVQVDQHEASESDDVRDEGAYIVIRGR